MCHRAIPFSSRHSDSQYWSCCCSTESNLERGGRGRVGEGGGGGGREGGRRRKGGEGEVE